MAAAGHGPVLRRLERATPAWARGRSRGRKLARRQLGIAFVGQPGDRRRQRLTFCGFVDWLVAGLELVQEMEYPGPSLEGVVKLEVILRDPLEAQPLTQLVLDQRHRPAECG